MQPMYKYQNKYYYMSKNKDELGIMLCCEIVWFFETDI
jgi:hypothetical protein